MVTKEFRTNPKEYQIYKTSTKRLIDHYSSLVRNKKQSKCDCLDGFRVAKITKESDNKTVAELRRIGKPLIQNTCKKVCPPGRSLPGFGIRRGGKSTGEKKNRKNKGGKKSSGLVKGGLFSNQGGKKSSGFVKGGFSKKEPKIEKTDSDSQSKCEWKKYGNNMKAFLCD